MLLAAVVLLPLSASSVISYLLTAWSARAETVAAEWISVVPGSSIAGADVISREIHIRVRTPGDLPPISGLLDAFRGRIPDGIRSCSRPRKEARSTPAGSAHPPKDPHDLPLRLTRA
ncbi:hypothetical protein OIE67_38985 [Nonomuraea fuscirosea]|uniref:hypothetical protein n=1 Tax=Nonomuraea fuscirosea TaxID=1291556 RepID=UPI002DDA3F3C|nr:hypothetical protein [Nonomuraea fuscirosea]WSA50009.1 hypothetical protein OIE67_38985 [Nonomuraea fuscirosea]